MGLKKGRKPTELGDFPSDWSEKSVKSYDPFVTSGSRGWARYYAKYGDLFVRITNMSRSSINLDLGDCRYVRLPLSEHEGSRTQLKIGDVLISITADIGITSFIDSSVPLPAYINQHVALIRFLRGNIDPKFVAYFLAHEASQRWFHAITDQGAKAGINLTTIRDIPLVIPPSEAEQCAIATALSDVDALLEGLDRLIAKKHDRKQAAMQQLLTGKTRLPGFEEKWVMKRLGDVIEQLVGGGTPSRANAAFWGREIPWITVKDFATFHPNQAQEYITKVGLNNSASHLIPAGTLITSTRMALGKAVIYDVDVAINQDLKAIFLKRGNSTRFLYYWFEHNAQVINDLGSGSTVKGISITELQCLPFPFLSETEQTAIATVLSDMDAEIEALKQRHAKTRDLKQAMMQELLTGKTRLVDKEVIGC